MPPGGSIVVDGYVIQTIGRTRNGVDRAAAFAYDGWRASMARHQGRDGVAYVLKSARHQIPGQRHVFADGGYAGHKLHDALTRMDDWALKIIKGLMSQRASPCCHSAGWLNASSHSTDDVASSPKTGTDPSKLHRVGYLRTYQTPRRKPLSYLMNPRFRLQMTCKTATTPPTHHKECP